MTLPVEMEQYICVLKSKTLLNSHFKVCILQNALKKMGHIAMFPHSDF